MLPQPLFNLPRSFKSSAVLVLCFLSLFQVGEIKQRRLRKHEQECLSHSKEDQHKFEDDVRGWGGDMKEEPVCCVVQVRAARRLQGVGV